MTELEIKKAINEGKTLIWNDPDPIKGNDYKISKVSKLNEETCLIEYNEGWSEAEVFLSEIDLIN